MEEPDFDDLINDYVEDAAPPPEYDDDYLEEMMGEVDEPAPAPSVPNNTTMMNSEVNITEEEPSEEHSDIGNAAQDDQVRDYIARQNDDTRLFHFQRYDRAAQWRTSESTNSSNAPSWNDTRTKLFQGGNFKPRHATAPEAQLLDFLRQRGADVPNMRLKQAQQSPVEGQPSTKMTLSDGSRVYIAMGKSSTSEAPSSKKSCLGVSMAEIKRRSDRIIRQRILRPSAEASPIATVGGDHQLWVDRHAPSSFSHLLSDERTNREVLRALRAWDPYVFGRDPPPRPNFETAANDANASSAEEPAKTNSNDKRPEENQRVLLLSGPPGVGKTTLAHVVARHAGYRPLEVNASDERSATVLTDRVRRAMESTTLSLKSLSSGGNKDVGKPNCIILDEIDGADAKGAIQALVEIIKADLPGANAGKGKAPYLRRPIIFICNHKYAPALRPLLPHARHFNVDPPSPTRLVARLKGILAAEKLNMMAGGSLLHQLVVASGGDIRSCLYTLQFAAAEAQNSKDLSQALSTSLGGTGLKDGRTDIASTITTVFRKVKARNFGAFSSATTREDRASVTRVLHAVDSLDDHSTTINSIFLNLLQVSYIDPTLDRCSAAHEWLSGADVFRGDQLATNDQMAQYGMRKLHMPLAAAAIHLLCRVELKPSLTFTTREMSDVHYQRETNRGLVQKFTEALPPRAKNIKCPTLISSEFIPFLVSILSADPALCRPASSLDVLTKLERQSVEAHVSTLSSLGLTYVTDLQDELTVHHKHPQRQYHKAVGHETTHKMRLEPPIDRLVRYAAAKAQPELFRKQIPTAMKALLAQQVRVASLRQTVGSPQPVKPAGSRKTSRQNSATSALPSPSDTKKTKPARVSLSPEQKRTTPQKIDDLALSAPPPKRAKTNSPSMASNFLGIGAKKYREALSARKAAAVGLQRSKKKKQTHTSSGLYLSQAIRLKYVKGFTQAVRTPCRLEDLG